MFSKCCVFKSYRIEMNFNLKLSIKCIVSCPCLLINHLLFEVEINVSDHFELLQGKGTGSGHRTLLYGNAILLRHQNSDMVR